MQSRRAFLAGLGGATLVTLAGCSSGESSASVGSTLESGMSQAQGGDVTTTEPSECVTETPTSTESQSPVASGEPDIVIGEGTFGTADFGYTQRPFYEVALTNEGDAPSGIIDLVIDWFDESGNYVDDTREELVSLLPGETWIARSYKILDDERVASAEPSGSYDLYPPEWPAGLEVASSELLAGPDNVKVRAMVENNTGQTVNYAAFYGKVYDAEGRVLGQVWTNEVDIPNGTTWRAEREWDDSARANWVETHQVVLQGTIY